MLLFCVAVDAICSQVGKCMLPTNDTFMCTTHCAQWASPHRLHPSLPSLSWLITGRPQHVANLVAWQRPPHCFNGHFNAPSSPQPPSRSVSLSGLLCLFLLSLLLLLPLPRRPACRLPHVRSCMFFFEKLFRCCLLRPTLLLISPTVPQPQPQPQHAPMPVALPFPPSCPLARAAGFCPRLGFYPRTHLARKRRARINLLNFAAFATVAAAASVAATASACGMY